ALFDSTSLPAILKKSGTVRQGCPPSPSLGQRHPLLICSLSLFFLSVYTTPLLTLRRLFIHYASDQHLCRRSRPIHAAKLNHPCQSSDLYSPVSSLNPPIHHPYSSSSYFLGVWRRLPLSTSCRIPSHQTDATYPVSLSPSLSLSLSLSLLPRRTPSHRELTDPHRLFPPPGSSPTAGLPIARTGIRC
ncbi:uncharacterized protein CCOS01_11589, partial [Colletotrichum costaricense]